MKKYFFVFVFFLSAVFSSINLSMFAADSKPCWRQRTDDQIENEFISDGLAKIAQYFTSLGGGAQSSSAYPSAIYKFLRDIGTPNSLQRLKQLIKEGVVPEYYLDIAEEPKTKTSADGTAATPGKQSKPKTTKE